MTKHTIDGVLKSAYWARFNNGEPYILGEITADRKGRFPDGTSIHTSAVIHYLGDNLFQTRNSIYEVYFSNHDNWPKEIRGDAPWPGAEELAAGGGPVRIVKPDDRPLQPEKAARPEHAAPNVDRQGLAADIMAKVADLNEAIEIAAGAGLVTYLELNRALTLQGFKAYDVPMFECLVTARL